MLEGHWERLDGNFLNSIQKRIQTTSDYDKRNITKCKASYATFIYRLTFDKKSHSLHIYSRHLRIIFNFGMNLYFKTIRNVILTKFLYSFSNQF